MARKATDPEPDARFTREMFLSMGDSEILDFWSGRNRARRDAGRDDYYDRLVDPVTGETVRTIDEVPQ